MEVHCAEIDPGNFKLEGVPFTEANLNRELPFEDESFDEIVSANGLHRLYNPTGAIRESFRVLRPGGRLHSTVSNYASMDKRLHFLLYGSLVKNINLTRHLQTTTDSEANVRHHLFYPQLHHILVGEGFAVTDLRAASVRTKDRFLTPLAWWVWLMTWVIPRRRWKRDRIRETRSRAISPGGKYLYVEAVKAGCR